jgi:hypothetical protein
MSTIDGKYNLNHIHIQMSKTRWQGTMANFCKFERSTS